MRVIETQYRTKSKGIPLGNQEYHIILGWHIKSVSLWAGGGGFITHIAVFPLALAASVLHNYIRQEER